MPSPQSPKKASRIIRGFFLAYYQYYNQINANQFEKVMSNHLRHDRDHGTKIG